MILEGPIDVTALKGLLANAEAEGKTVYGQVMLDTAFKVPLLKVVTKDKVTYGESVNIPLEEIAE